MDPSRIDQEAMAQYSRWHGVMPAQRQAEDISNLALHLASDEARRINGALVAADAGWSAA